MHLTPSGLVLICLIMCAVINVRFNLIVRWCFVDFRTDPKLFRDDIDIKFSRSLNSCKVPQVRNLFKSTLNMELSSWVILET